MNKTFKIGQSNEFVQGDMVFDVHNRYSLAALSLGSDRSLVISFEPDPEHGAGCNPFTLVFSEVDFLLMSDDVGVRGGCDVDEVGYKEPTDFDDEWLSSEGQASVGDHLFIRLVGGGFIRVHAKEAVLSEGAPLGL